MNSGHYLYEKYPYPFGIAIIVGGCYAGGSYHELQADMFLSRDLLDAHIAILSAKKDPVGHICKTCAKVCRNLTVSGFCCDWEQIAGTVSGRWG